MRERRGERKARPRPVRSRALLLPSLSILLAVLSYAVIDSLTRLPEALPYPTPSRERSSSSFSVRNGFGGAPRAVLSRFRRRETSRLFSHARRGSGSRRDRRRRRKFPIGFSAPWNLPSLPAISLATFREKRQLAHGFPRVTSLRKCVVIHGKSPACRFPSCPKDRCSSMKR